MKNSLNLLLFFSLIYLIYSCDANTVKVAETDEGEEICGTPITDCTTYDPTSTANAVKCAVCALPKVPAANAATCVACDDGEETKDGKLCHTKITDCDEYATDGKCTKCTGKIPKSDGSACEACPDGKETKDGKTCVDKTTSFSSFIKISNFALLYLLNIL